MHTRTYIYLCCLSVFTFKNIYRRILSTLFSTAHAMHHFQTTNFQFRRSLPMASKILKYANPRPIIITPAMITYSAGKYISLNAELIVKYWWASLLRFYYSCNRCNWFFWRIKNGIHSCWRTIFSFIILILIV